MVKDLATIKKIIKNTVASNKNDIYSSHLYWSQKPYNICDIILEHFSESGDVIMDPFMGSGVTIIQSLHKTLNRKAIGVEINEVPIFIVDTLLDKYDITTIETKIHKFLDEVNKLNYYYETECISCGGKGIIQKVIFNRENWKAEINIKEIHYKCSCNSRNLVKKPSQEDKAKLECNEKIINIENLDLINNSRLAVYEGQKISDIFTKRNFKILDNVIEIINKEKGQIQKVLKYILLSVLHLSKITDLHSNSQWPLWTPKTNCVEKNVITLLNKRAKLFIKAINYAEKNLNETRVKVHQFKKLRPGNYMLLKKGCQYITQNDIPDNSVDLIITDPPYLGQILYSEYMQLYRPFLGLEFNLQDEIVVSSSPEREKNEEEYYDLLEKSFMVIGSKLKVYKYMCMYFHDSNLKVWNKLIKILEKAGLRYLSQVHIEKKNTLKNIISPKKSLKGDALLFFIKEPNYETKQVLIENIEEIERNIVKHAKYLITQKGPLTTPELYDDGMMEFIIHNGWLATLAEKYKSLIDIFEKYLIWDKDLGKWKI